MQFRQILVHIDHYASSRSRLQVAVGLARRHQARLTGLLVIRHQNPTADAVAAARELFEQETAEAGVEARWLCIDGSAAELGTNAIVAHHAHASDLLVVGQGSQDSANVGVPFDLPESAVLNSGRPVLVVPFVGTFPSVGDRVLIAWKSGRECARAVHDALPLLVRAERVEILAKRRPGQDLEDGEALGAELGSYLGRHGVAATEHFMSLEETPLGEALLNRVFDENFDLLVVGAHPHGHEGRLTLGSVGRHLLKEMTVPVLMSH